MIGEGDQIQQGAVLCFGVTLWETCFLLSPPHAFHVACLTPPSRTASSLLLLGMEMGKYGTALQHFGPMQGAHSLLYGTKPLSML